MLLKYLQNWFCSTIGPDNILYWCIGETLSKPCVKKKTQLWLHRAFNCNITNFLLVEALEKRNILRSLLSVFNIHFYRPLGDWVLSWKEQLNKARSLFPCVVFMDSLNTAAWIEWLCISYIFQIKKITDILHLRFKNVKFHICWSVCLVGI